MDSFIQQFIHSFIHSIIHLSILSIAIAYRHYSKSEKNRAKTGKTPTLV